MGCWLVLLDMVPLHDFSFLVQTEVPAPARLLLPVYHGGVCHIIVLEHRLLEFALRCKVFLGDKGEADPVYSSCWTVIHKVSRVSHGMSWYEQKQLKYTSSLLALVQLNNGTLRCTSRTNSDTKREEAVPRLKPLL